MDKKPPIYGLLAEFDDAERILEAANKVREAGFKFADAYSPFPVHGLSDAIGFHKSRVPLCGRPGGIIGGRGGFFMQYYSNVFCYPEVIAGRPFNSWPAWIPITFECTVLGAALTAVFGMLALNGLPRPSHPLFNVPNFQLASRNRFFIVIESRDPKFDLTQTRGFLEGLHPLLVSEVPA
jgi:hypothetical protein